MERLGLIVCLILTTLLTVRATYFCDGFTNKDFNLSDVLPKMLVHSTPGKVKVVADTALIDGIGVEIRVDCWAPFPIDFEFHGHLSNRDATVNVIERTASNYKDISTFCFHINITIRSFEEMTGEYVCFKVQNQSASKSCYIYPAAHPLETLLNRGQSLAVEAPSNNAWVTLPCAISNPEVPVNLYNERNSSISLGANVLMYDPKIGFIMKVNKDSWGKYQCRTDLSDRDMVEVRILPPKGFLVVPPERQLILKEGDILTVSCESTQDIIIQSNSIIQINQISGKPRWSENRKLEFFLQYQSEILKDGDTGIVSCLRKSDNQILHEWIFHVKQAKSAKLQSEKSARFNAYLCSGGLQLTTLYGCNNWIECKMRKCARKDRKCESIDCKDSRSSNCLPSGILQCYNKQNESSQDLIYFSGLNPNKSYTHWSTAPQKDILRIQKFLLSTSKNSSMIVKVVCEGSSFVFAVGFKWFLITKEGSQLEVAKDKIENKWRSEKSKHIIKSTAEINITDDVSTILCKAPVWNTTEWMDDILALADLEKSFGGISNSSTDFVYDGFTRSVMWILVLLSLIRK